MKRFSQSDPSPLSKLQLSGSHVWLRIAMVVALVAMAAAFFGFGIQAALTREPGWQQIEAVSPQTLAVRELTLQYRVTTSDEQRTLPVLFTQKADRAYQIFSGERFDGVRGLGELNANPGQTVMVEPELYAALELLEQVNSRYLYYAPVYEQYRGVFGCDEDSEILSFDPEQSGEIDAYLAQVRRFASDSEAVQVTLLGENQARLTVSQEYQAFARENGIGAFLDFFWLRNAFTVDLVADALAEAGYTQGVVASFEGFARVLGEGSYAMELYDRSGDTLGRAATIDYTGPKSVAVFRAFPLSSMDAMHYYVLSDGTVRTPYIGETDSRCHKAAQSLTAFSDQGGCARLALRLLPVYTADTLDEGRLRSLEGVSAAWTGEADVMVSGEDIRVRK